jgi:hypothetical protein
MKNMLKLLNVIGFTGTVIVNFLANYIPINGKNTGELSDFYPNLFVPTGLTFSIWGIIYLLLAGFSIYQIGIFKSSKEYANLVVEKIGILFFVSSIANITWIITWHYEKVLLSLIIMIILLVSLILMYRRLSSIEKVNFSKTLFTKIPFSIYLGWITVATIANFVAFFVDIGWNGFGIAEEIWTIALIISAMAITFYILAKYKDIWYTTVIIWAILGIILKHINFFNWSYPEIIYTGIFVIVTLTVGDILIGFKRKQILNS